jgi:hypothetical protein
MIQVHDVHSGTLYAHMHSQRAKRKAAAVATGDMTALISMRLVGVCCDSAQLLYIHCSEVCRQCAKARTLFDVMIISIRSICLQ